MRWAALLKGVNVGGNRKLPMADLRAFLAGLGFTDVKTLLASGNAVFDADETDGAALESQLERAAKTQLGLDTAWLLRSHADLVAIVAANPFADAAAAHPNHLLVHFHRDPVPVALLDALVHDGPERLSALGRELFVDYPDDVGHSKLPQAMARAKFPKLATARNWNSLLKLVELTA
ncbi:MAG: DUF1697 domain-containing protein [Sphingomonas sp.]|jgi:uncharacterized protein (DUF1697 family)|uniref:DUF1697 domain-containing protein n=1 Tax=Sphingomonas sp. TaxID=28214 RepID=UPI00356A1B71